MLIRSPCGAGSGDAPGNFPGTLPRQVSSNRWGQAWANFVSTWDQLRPALDVICIIVGLFMGSRLDHFFVNSLAHFRPAWGHVGATLGPILGAS